MGGFGQGIFIETIHESNRVRPAWICMHEAQDPLAGVSDVHVILTSCSCWRSESALEVRAAIWRFCSRSHFVIWLLGSPYVCHLLEKTIGKGRSFDALFPARDHPRRTAPRRARQEIWIAGRKETSTWPLAAEVERTPSSKCLPSSYVDGRWVSCCQSSSIQLK